MSVAENKQIIQAFYDAANRGDTAGSDRGLRSVGVHRKIRKLRQRSS
jgi:hypothetical protein